MTKYEYATRDIDKIEQAKLTIEQQAAARKQTILGWNIYTADDHPRLQEHAPGVMHLFVEGYTTQAEVATLPPQLEHHALASRLAPIAKPLVET
jgi:hypothetical protein